MENKYQIKESEVQNNGYENEKWVKTKTDKRQITGKHMNIIYDLKT